MKKINWMMSRVPFPDAIKINQLEEHKTDYETKFNGTRVNVMTIKEFGIYEEVLNSKCIDIAFGAGDPMFHLAENGNGEYIANELDIDGCNFLEKKKKEKNISNLKIINSEIEKVSLPKESMDFIFAFHILEHLENPLNVLLTVKEWLKKDGRIIIVTPNVGGYHPKKFGLEKWRHAGSNHVWLPSKESLSSLVEYSGFKIEKSFTYGGFPAASGFLKKTIGNKLLKKFDLGDAVCIMAKKM
jgi:2-polyprenyl-3-methyl-5-hydroxy-6-metoxy-1,4-benzoquinol methylase